MSIKFNERPLCLFQETILVAWLRDSTPEQAVLNLIEAGLDEVSPFTTAQVFKLLGRANEYPEPVDLDDVIPVHADVYWDGFDPVKPALEHPELKGLPDTTSLTKGPGCSVINHKD